MFANVANIAVTELMIPSDVKHFLTLLSSCIAEEEEIMRLSCLFVCVICCFCFVDSSSHVVTIQQKLLCLTKLAEQVLVHLRTGAYTSEQVLQKNYRSKVRTYCDLTSLMCFSVSSTIT